MEERGTTGGKGECGGREGEGMERVDEEGRREGRRRKGGGKLEDMRVEKVNARKRER